MFLDETSPYVVIVVPDGLNHLREGEPITSQGLGVYLDVILLFKTSDPEDLRHSGNAHEIGFDDPVLKGPEIGEGVAPGGVFEIIEEDQSHGSGDGAQLRVAETLGDGVPGLGQALAHHLAGEVNVGAVLEIEVYQGETEVGDRTDLLEPGKPVHGGLDGVGDVFFHLLRGQTFGLGEDLDQDRGHVREGVDGKFPKGGKSGHHDPHRQDHHQEPVTQGKIYEFLPHGMSSFFPEFEG